jgi:hypothetical protein
VGGGDHPPTKVDLIVRLPGEHISRYIDVSIVSPVGEKYLDLKDGQKKPVGSDRVRLAAAEEKEAHKKQHHRVGIASNVGRVIFVPFVLEVGGAMGPAARKFVEGILGESLGVMAKYTLSPRIEKTRFFIRQLNATLVRGLEKCMLSYRNNIYGEVDVRERTNQNQNNNDGAEDSGT